MESEYAPFLLILLFVAFSVLVVFTIARAYRPLLGLLLIGQTFSIGLGAVQGLMTLVRFAALFALSILAIHGLSRLRSLQVLTLLLAAYMLALTPISDVPMWSLQKAIALFALSLGLAGATINYTQDFSKIQKTLMVVVVVALAWVVVNALFGGTVTQGPGQGRFTGIGGRTGAAAGVGGFLCPFLLWGYLQPIKKQYRWACLGGLLICVPMLVYIGQRIGLFSALVGMLPMLAMRLGFRKIVGMAMISAVSLVLSFQLMSMLDPGLRDFLLDKYVYNVSDTSGRAERWAVMLQVCLGSPFLPHGYGASNFAAAGAFGGEVHNSYLNIWYDGGFQAVLIWVALIALTVLRCARLLAGGLSPPAKETARLLLGCMLALASQGFFEGSLSSPTNLNIGLFLLVLTLTDRMLVLQTQGDPLILESPPQWMPAAWSRPSAAW